MVGEERGSYADDEISKTMREVGQRLGDAEWTVPVSRDGEGSMRRIFGVYRNVARQIRVGLGQQIRYFLGRSLVLRVFCGTWNVNGKKPLVELESWLFPDGRKTKPMDLFIIAIQEAQALSSLRAVLTDQNRGRVWKDEIQRTLTDEYELVGFRQLVGIMLVIFARKGVEVQDLMIADAGTGFLNVIGNKGGVAARFVVNSVSLSCVSSHLAARERNIYLRNQNFHDILKRAKFTERNRSGTDSEQQATGRGIMDHDVVFWLGDMNYRIALPISEVMDLIRRKDWKTLAKYDQLRTEMKAKNVAPDFEEGPLTFPPTYKLASDHSGYQKNNEGGVKRTPSWTDRILWKSKLRVRLASYRRHEVLSSDHRPVSAIFEIPIKKAGQARAEAQQSESCVRTAPKLEVDEANAHNGVRQWKAPHIADEHEHVIARNTEALASTMLSQTNHKQGLWNMPHRRPRNVRRNPAYLFAYNTSMPRRSQRNFVRLREERPTSLRGESGMEVQLVPFRSQPHPKSSSFCRLVHCGKAIPCTYEDGFGERLQTALTELSIMLHALAAVIWVDFGVKFRPNYGEVAQARFLKNFPRSILLIFTSLKLC